MTVHSFALKAAASDTDVVHARVEEILTAKIEARTFRWTEPGGPDDRHGIDVWAILPNRKNVGIDVKANRWGEVRLEYVSRAREGVVGWTVDDTKLTDYVLNLWPGRYWLIDFPCLKAVAKARREDYQRWYGPKATHSSSDSGAGWETRFVPVPVGRLMFDIFDQAPMGMPLTPPRLCPSCHQSHPVGTTCSDGWAPYENGA
jgi:hypothetical protein